MPNFIDLKGQKFSRLTVVSMLVERGKRKEILWYCRCDCGNDKIAPGGGLRAGNYTSCGCLLREIKSANNKKRSKHGYAGTHIYFVWAGMNSRCYVPTAYGYSYYGGRGIGVCQQWRRPLGITQFIKDMGPPPSNKHQIDRIRNDGDYEPGNCRWATHGEQQQNRRDNIYATHNGETLCVSEWARRFGISRNLIYKRLRIGVPIGEIKETLHLKWEDLKKKYESNTIKGVSECQESRKTNRSSFQPKRASRRSR